MYTQTKTSQQKITPEVALSYLIEGNRRFVSNHKINRNLLQQVTQTSAGQFPFATILSCIDSRTSAELIFDQGIGDIFSIRIAGNILNDDILGCMEYAGKAANSKLLVVLGHTRCSAIKCACDNLEMDHFTNLLDKLKPAINEEKETTVERNGRNLAFVENVSVHNIKLTIKQIRQKSTILRELERDGMINIVGGLYSVETGEVKFYADIEKGIE